MLGRHIDGFVCVCNGDVWAHWVISILLAGCFQMFVKQCFGGSAECSSKMWEICDFSHDRLTLRLQPSLEKCKFGKLLLPLWNSTQRVFGLYVCATRVQCEYMCVCVYLWWVPRSALIGYAIFFSPSLFCPQVRVWLLIPWAAVLLNLQHMIHNRSPVKLNHSLLWPLINIQWRTQSLSWSASSPIYSAFSCL